MDIIGNATLNTINQSSITASAGNAMFFSGANNNTVVNSYVQGSTAAWLTGANANSITASTLAANGASGSALAVVAGAGANTIANLYLAANSAGAAAVRLLGELLFRLREH